jgi:hypothetical protein
VAAAAFCPFEPDAFMTAGRDSMRCYRLVGGALRGMSVRRTGGAGPLGPPAAAPRGGPELPAQAALLPGTAPAGAAAGPNVFTAIAFEAGVAAGQAARSFAFVGSAAGVVFQVDYPRRCVVAAYGCHLGAINALAVGEGLAVTASDDRRAGGRATGQQACCLCMLAWGASPAACDRKALIPKPRTGPKCQHALPSSTAPSHTRFLRVWPLDFRAYLLEAEHDAPLAAAAIGPGGLRVAAGCEGGTVGVLDMAAQRYATAARSHTGRVLAAAAHPTR